LRFEEKFQELDTNNSRSLCFAEFGQLFEEVVKEQEDLHRVLRRCFDRVSCKSAQKNGTVTRAELLQGMHEQPKIQKIMSLQGPIWQKGFEERFTAMDCDGSAVSFEEFAACVAFHLVDKDLDASVTRGELLRAIRRQPEVRGFLGLERGVLTNLQFEKKFEQLDTDNSRTLSFKEFAALFDPNQDGFQHVSSHLVLDGWMDLGPESKYAHAISFLSETKYEHLPARGIFSTKGKGPVVHLKGFLHGSTLMTLQLVTWQPD